MHIFPEGTVSKQTCSWHVFEEASETHLITNQIYIWTHPVYRRKAILLLRKPKPMCGTSGGEVMPILWKAILLLRKPKPMWGPLVVKWCPFCGKQFYYSENQSLCVGPLVVKWCPFCAAVQTPWVHMYCSTILIYTTNLNYCLHPSKLSIPQSIDTYTYPLSYIPTTSCLIQMPWLTGC